jgi:hypothetical protein
MLLKSMPLFHPIVPVLDSLLRLFINVDAFELTQGDTELARIPRNQHEHVVQVRLLGRHSNNRDLLALFERRDFIFFDSPGRERVVQVFVKIHPPAHGPLF